MLKNKFLIFISLISFICCGETPGTYNNFTKTDEYDYQKLYSTPENKISELPINKTKKKNNLKTKLKEKLNSGLFLKKRLKKYKTRKKIKTNKSEKFLRLKNKNLKLEIKKLNLEIKKLKLNQDQKPKNVFENKITSAGMNKRDPNNKNLEVYENKLNIENIQEIHLPIIKWIKKPQHYNSYLKYAYNPSRFYSIEYRKDRSFTRYILKKFLSKTLIFPCNYETYEAITHFSNINHLYNLDFNNEINAINDKLLNHEFLKTKDKLKAYIILTKKLIKNYNHARMHSIGTLQNILNIFDKTVHYNNNNNKFKENIDHLYDNISYLIYKDFVRYSRLRNGKKINQLFCKLLRDFNLEGSKRIKHIDQILKFYLSKQPNERITKKRYCSLNECRLRL